MKVELHLGDCLEVMAELPENSVDTILTDPPYGLEFMGKDWDRGVPGVAFWEQALRVAKPGAMLLAMGGTRTFHRLVVAIEDAGWIVRDSMAWLYGSGFPKSHNISKGIDKKAGAKREKLGRVKGCGSNSGESRYNWNNPDDKTDRTWYDATAPSTPAAQLWHGWGTALKPAMELICVAMKPIDGTYVNNALTWGVAGLWIDGGRVGTSDSYSYPNGAGGNSFSVGESPDGKRVIPVASHSQGRFPANVILSYPEDEYELRDDTTPEQLRMLAEWFDENA